MIVWDEVSMSHCDIFGAVNHMLQDVQGNGCPFGGLTVVCGGDFQQTLPVILRGSCEQIVQNLPFSTCPGFLPDRNHVPH